MIAQVAAQSSTGLGSAVGGLLTIETLAALLFQAVLFVVLIANRRSPWGWPHIAAMIVSALLTYSGWSSVWLLAAPHIAGITATVPAALLGGATGWLLLHGSMSGAIPRWLQVTTIAAGVLAGILGDVMLLQFTGLLVAWVADRIARRVMVIG